MKDVSETGAVLEMDDHYGSACDRDSDPLMATIKPVLQLVETIYGSIREPHRFDSLVTRWDHAQSKSLPNAESEELKEIIDAHFSQALELNKDYPVVGDQTFTEVILERRAPALVLDRRLRILAAHEEALARLSLDRQLTLDDILTENPALADLTDMVRDCRGGLLTLERDGSINMLWVTPLPASDAMLVSLRDASLPDTVTDALQTLFQMSPAEIRVAEHLVAGLSATEISDVECRSLETVRSHIKSLLQKTETRRQTDLVRRILMLADVLPVRKRPAQTTVGPAGDNLEQAQITLADGRAFAYARYGKKGGIPVLYLTTSSLPEESAAVRAAMAAAGLDVIAPYRPGFGSSDPTSRGADALGTLATDCVTLLKALNVGPVVVSGHREGGVLASAVATELSKKQAARGLVLCNAGAPRADAWSVSQFPNNARRTFDAAVRSPTALVFGYKVARQLFRSGSWGERRIVEYFVEDNPIDTAALQLPDIYEILRRNLHYCFEDCAEIVRDIALWSSRWDAVIPDALPLHFIHAGGHDFLTPESVEAYAAVRPNTTVTIIENAGQTMLYTHPRSFADSIRALGVA